MSKNYFNITEPEFADIKNKIVRNASSELERLASRKRSNLLDTGEYYSWLWEIFEQNKGRHVKIRAISTMLDSEWDNKSPQETRFIRENTEAAKRGCTVERIFIMKRELLAKALQNDHIKLHMVEARSGLNGFVVMREDLERADPKLLSRIKDGFLGFDERVILIDDYAKDGSARGAVVMHPSEISELLDDFNKLRTFAHTLDSRVAALPSAG